MPATVTECPAEVYVDTLGHRLEQPRKTTVFVAWCNECIIDESGVNWYGTEWPVGYVSAPKMEALLESDAHNDERHGGGS